MTPYRSRTARTMALAVRMLLGVFFIVSAIGKWVDIDHFEIHVFSYNILSLNASLLMARFIVVAEMLVGIGLLSNIWHRFVNACAVLMLVGFTLFLGYAVIIGREDSCQCMGALVEMNPTQSIVKNAVLLAALYFGMHCRAWQWRPRWWMWLPVVVAVPATLLIVSAPDNWLFGQEDEVYNTEALQTAMEQGVLQSLPLDEGRHVVAFVTAGCQFCRMADQKLTSICHRAGIDSTALVYLVLTKDTAVAALTVNDTSFLQPAYTLDRETFVTITYGQRPMILLMDGGEVKGSCHYRNIDEHRIVRFLKNDDEENTQKD